MEKERKGEQRIDEMRHNLVDDAMANFGVKLYLESQFYHLLGV